MPFVATGMELEILILSEVRKRKTNTICHYIWNLIHSTNEFTCRKETNSWTWRTDLWMLRVRWMQWEGLGVWG